MRIALFRRKPPTLLERLDALVLNALAAAWAVRIVWSLSHGRLPRSRSTTPVAHSPSSGCQWSVVRRAGSVLAQKSVRTRAKRSGSS